MLLIAALLLVVTSAYGQYQMNIRDNGKLCTPWIDLTRPIPLWYIPSDECISEIKVQQILSILRLCCDAMATSVPTSISTSTFSTDVPSDCGKQKFQPSKARIVGGVQAVPNSWPWQVRLHANGGLCGGSLIDNRHVLTAAHCFSEPLVLQNHEILVGIHDVGKPVYGEQRYGAQKIFIHEAYNTHTQENDIAIIRLSRPVTISDTVNVICLPGAEAKNVNDTLWVAGWGTMSFQGEVSPVLQQTSLHHMPTDCSRVYGNYDHEKQMCAGAHGGGRDTCQGDSGGPLMYESNGQWFLNGIVSFGFECARDGYPGVYTRVSYYLPWIHSKVASP